MTHERRWRTGLLAAAVLTSLAWAGCGDDAVRPDPIITPDAQVDGGSPDGGADGGTGDGGTGDGGTETDGGTDAGDGGAEDGGVTQTFPTLEGWTFYGVADGAPSDVRGVTEDAAGNVWVAGGVDGLFLLRPGATQFERFGVEDGLRPYGYMPDGSAPPGAESIRLEVLSVAGGPAGTVFVGYAGHPSCESNWDGPTPDPAIYKSGDADRVTLTADGISVVHYDIFSGPGVVGGYFNADGSPRAREKVCSIFRLAYDASTQSVWFGGNHGFARGQANHPGDPTCNGQLACSNVLEHAHPHIGARDEHGNIVTLTADYWGVAPAPNGDVWFGGANRSTRFRYMSNARGPANYFRAQYESEADEYAWNRLDVWPDAVDESGYPSPSQRTEDLVSAIVAMPDGTAWVSSFAWGLARLDASGNVLGYALTAAADRNISALGRDPRDQSLWAGHRFGGGVTRLRGGSVERFGLALGPLGEHPVLDVQGAASGGARRMWFAFGSLSGQPGAVGLYQGP